MFDYPHVFWRVRSVFAIVLVVLSVIFWASLMVILVTLGLRRHSQTWMLRAWNLWVLWIFGIRVKVEGLENYDSNRACLVVTNHQSLFDIPAAFYALSGHIRMVAKQELFSIPFFGWAINRTEFVPVDRGNRTSGARASKMIGERIRSGLQVWVAPEGSRSDGSTIMSFKKGSFAVAIDAQIPVQPIVVMNAWKVCPKSELLVRPGLEITVKILPTVPTEGLKIEDRADLAVKVHGLMLAVYR